MSKRQSAKRAGQPPGEPLKAPRAPMEREALAIAAARAALEKRPAPFRYKLTPETADTRLGLEPPHSVPGQQGRPTGAGSVRSRIRFEHGSQGFASAIGRADQLAATGIRVGRPRRAGALGH